jgi:hypothetical protein
MIEVSDRIADNPNGQFGFDTELDASRSSPNKGMQTSVRSTGLGRCFCYLLTLPNPKRYSAEHQDLACIKKDDHK